MVKRTTEAYVVHHADFMTFLPFKANRAGGREERLGGRESVLSRAEMQPIERPPARAGAGPPSNNGREEDHG